MKNEAARRAASAFHSLNAESGLLMGHGRDAFGVVVDLLKSRTMSKYCDISLPYSSLERRASPPSSSLERDFCRRRQTRQKGPEHDISAQRPEIGDYHVREMAAKTAFLLTNCQLRVSEDWVVGEPQSHS
jgi:hypothetical protein